MNLDKKLVELIGKGRSELLSYDTLVCNNIIYYSPILILIGILILLILVKYEEIHEYRYLNLRFNVGVFSVCLIAGSLLMWICASLDLHKIKTAPNVYLIESFID